MRFLHIFPNGAFAKPFVNFINKYFDPDEHLFFLLTGKNTANQMITEKNVKNFSGELKDIGLLMQKMNKCEKILIHNLSVPPIVCILFIQPWLYKKVNWIVWGGDLHWYRTRSKNIKSNLYEIIRALIIKNIGEITTLVKGDYELAKLWYHIKGKYHHGIYINPITAEYLACVKNKKEDNIVNIQVGNSAAPDNNHIEVLRLLKRFDNENINIFVPLSYGDNKYAQDVVEYGKKNFGEKFKPLLHFLDAKDYSQYLAAIDIAIFNHKRQQALGNIFALLYLGKKVYIRNDISTWPYLREELNLNITSYQDIANQTFSQFVNFNNSRDNKEKIKIMFDLDYIKKVWEKVFFD